MPPLPQGVLDQPAEPGLHVTYADDGFLFATKLIAQRAKDADDTSALEFIVDGSDVDREISLLAQDASRMLRRTSASDADATHVDPDTDTERLRRSTNHERRTSPPRGDDPGPRDPNF